jgi:hypothetical protein
MEKEMSLLKMQMEAVKSENGVMRDVIAVLKEVNYTQLNSTD